MTLAPDRTPGTTPTPEDLIKEARRRQRLRYAVIGLAVLALVAGLVGGLALTGGPASSIGSRTHAKPVRPATQAAPHPAPLAPGIGTSLLLWPAGPTVWDHGGPPVLTVDLGTGQFRRSDQPAISAGDFQPLLVRTGRWLVYAGDGTMAIRDDLRGRPRVLAKTPFFVPAAAPGRVWLFRFRAGMRGPVRARTMSAAGGRPSRTVTLPATASLPAIRGTDAGLLLQTRHGLALWRPGGAPRPLPYSPNLSDGFDATPRLVAYGTGCADEATAASSTYEPNAGYEACGMLRVFDVVTGKLISFPAPAGTAGWVPNGFGLVSAISPHGAKIAAYASIRSRGSGRVHLYLLQTGRAGASARPVPASVAFLFARTAWSARGGWLLYQGPDGQMSAYRPGTGTVRRSRLPCCQYTVMVTAPGGGQAGS